MADVLVVALSGLGLGALYAVLGQSLVLARLASGTVFFGVAAVAVYGTYQFTELRERGDLVLPWFDVIPGDLDVPVRLSLSSAGLGFWPSFLGAVLTAGVLGLLVHLLVAHPLRRAAAVARVLGAVGVLLYLQGVVLLGDRLGEGSRDVESVLSDRTLTDVLGTDRNVPAAALYAAAVAVLLAVGLWALLRWTRLGLALRAAPAGEAALARSGIRLATVGAVAWTAAGMLAATAGIVTGPLAGPLVGVSATSWLVPALAVAVAGGFRSVGWVTLTGLLVGAGQALVADVAVADATDWFPDLARFGLPEAMPVAVLAVALLVRRSPVEPRRDDAEPRRPLAPVPPAPPPERMWAWAAAGVGAVLMASLALSGVWEQALITSVISAVLMLSYVVLAGYLGDVALGQLAVAGVAAFVLVRLMNEAPADPAGRGPFPGWLLVVALPLAVGAAVVVGVVTALPAWRGRTAELAMITLAAAFALERWYFDNPALTGVTPGTRAPLPAANPGPVDLANPGGDRFAFSALAVVALAVCAAAVANLRRSRSGRRLLAVRAHPGAADAIGLSAGLTRLLAVGAASALAGVAGALFAMQRGEVGAPDWTLTAGLVVLAFAAVGGLTSVGGAFAGALLTSGGLLAVYGVFHVTALHHHLIALAGLGLVAVAVLLPGGLAPVLSPPLARMTEAVLTWRSLEWVNAGFRYGPWLLAGAAAGWVLWVRHGGYSWWMLALGAGLALVTRQLLEQVIRWVRATAQARQAGQPVDARAAPASSVPARWAPPRPPGHGTSANGSSGNGAVTELAPTVPATLAWASSNGNGNGHDAGNDLHAANGRNAGNGHGAVTGGHPNGRATRQAPAVPGLTVPRPKAYLAQRPVPPPPPGAAPLLAASHLTVRFGPLKAVDGLDLAISPASVTAVVGPNGAGKTTLARALTGAVPAIGSLTFAGRRLSRSGVWRRARHGLVALPSRPQLFADLTVRENVMAACDRPRWWTLPADLVWPSRRSRAAEEEAAWAIGALGLEREVDLPAGSLPPTRHQLVALARAVATRPRLLVLDEPALTLDHLGAQLLRRLLRDLPARGTTVLLLDHDFGLALDVCDVAHVLVGGRLVASGSPFDLAADEGLLEVFAGAPARASKPLPPPSLPPPRLPTLPPPLGAVIDATASPA